MSRGKVGPTAGRPPRTEYLIFGSPQILEPEIEEVVATLRSCWIGTGPRVEAFERAFAEYAGAPHAVAVSSCTAALHLAMMVLGLEAGEEVIVPSLTFPATANSVIHAGGRPVLADVDRDTQCLDPEDVARRITPRTRGIVPVHFAGRLCPIEPFRELAAKHGLWILEDCAHAVGTLVGEKHVGTLGDIGAFSFYVTKNLVTGEGGMVTTANGDWAARIRTLALHGLSADAWTRFSDAGFKRYEVNEPGFKYNMVDLQAALGLHQLRRVETGLERRAQLWSRYVDGLAELPLFLPQQPEPGTRHARHLFTVMIDIDRLGVGRDDVQESLHEQNIGTGTHFRALHLHRYYREAFGYRPEDFPHARWISERTLSLPLSPKLTEDDIDDVIQALSNALAHPVG